MWIIYCTMLKKIVKYFRKSPKEFSVLEKIISNINPFYKRRLSYYSKVDGIVDIKWFLHLYFWLSLITYFNENSAATQRMNFDKINWNLLSNWRNFLENFMKLLYSNQLIIKVLYYVLSHFLYFRRISKRKIRRWWVIQKFEKWYINLLNWTYKKYYGKNMLLILNASYLDPRFKKLNFV